MYYYWDKLHDESHFAKKGYKIWSPESCHDNQGKDLLDWMCLMVNSKMSDVYGPFGLFLISCFHLPQKIYAFVEWGSICKD